MDEEEFDALINLRPFGTADAMRWEAQVRDDIRLRMKLGSEAKRMPGLFPADLEER